MTPFHLGGGLFLGSLSRRSFSLWALLLASALPDLEPLYLIFVRGCYASCPHHAFFHSIPGAILGSLALALLLYGLRGVLKMISINVFRYNPPHPFSFKVLFFSSLAGWLLHVFFDSLTHYDVFPFWPSSYNPILIGSEAYWPLHLVLLALGIIGALKILKAIKSR